MNGNEKAAAAPGQNVAAATDVDDFISDLDGGQFGHKLSVALSTVAAAVVDNKRKGKVLIEFDMQLIPGTSQVHVEHTMKFVRPTEHGESAEKETRTTAMHVGKYGKLTIHSENQLSMFDKQGNTNTTK